MFTESNDPVEKLSDLMPSTAINIGDQEVKFSFEEYPGISSTPVSDRAFIYQKEGEVDKLFQLAPAVISKSDAYNALVNINMQDPKVISTLISNGSEIVKRCDGLDSANVTVMVLQEKIDIDGKPFKITYLPENSMFRNSYETRIRNRVKR